MFRLSAFCSLGLLLFPTAGCHFNQSLASLSPSQIISSEQSRRGVAALEHGDWIEAEKRLEDAVKLNKNDINFRRHYAEALWQQGKHQESLLQLNEAVKRGGHNTSLHVALAEKYLVMQEYSTAYRHADEAVRLSSQDARTWALRGKALRLQTAHQPKSAEHTAAMLHQVREDYLRAVSLASEDRELLAELASVQMSCRQPEQALATWLGVQRLYPQGEEPADVLVGKTETLLALQRFDEAHGCLTVLRQRGLPVPAMEQRWQEMVLASRSNLRR